MKTAIVTTTINIPTFLDDICKNSTQYNHKDIKIIVVGDKKTPIEITSFLQKLSNKFSIKIDYYDLEKQEKKLSRFKDLLSIIPYNSGARKLLGNFIAYMEGFEIVIQIDDDNFIDTTKDFIGHHKRVGSQIDIDVTKSESGWFNIYEYLIEENNIPFFPRGFPWSKRNYSKSNYQEININKKIVLINGLVFEDPDIDAISRLFWPIRVTGSKKNLDDCFGLYPGTWSSFNNQNTSTNRELTSVYFTPVCVGRNSDIWTSFVMCKLAEVAGDVISFGAPYVKQLRNEHDLWDDLKLELDNNILTDYFTTMLKDINIVKASYMDMLLQIIKESKLYVEKDNSLSEKNKNYINKYFEEYYIWAKSFDLI